MTYQIPFRQGQRLLELGGGEKPVIRPNLDARAMATVDIVADLNKPPLPVPDGQLDGVFCSYALEHISWRTVPALLADVARILAPGGVAVFVIPNTEAQLKWTLAREEWDEKIAQCLFGDQDYQENAHRAAFSPDYVFRLFRDAGFVDVIVLPHGEQRTDMIVEAKKGIATSSATSWTTEQRKEAYGRDYFNGGGKVGGYALDGYWDFPCHWLTFAKVMERKPKSVLELGCARGYVLKRLEDAGVRVMGFEVSDHCRLTRAVQDVLDVDVTHPWPLKNEAFDLAFSIATLEHIPEASIPHVAAELARTCARGLHGIDFGGKDDGFDKTHCTLKPKEWWQKMLPPGHEVVDKEELERGMNVGFLPVADGKVKLNVGSFKTMFHHGWINIDQHPLQDWARPYAYEFRQHDVRAGLLYPDDSVDLICASHFLEHLSYRDGAAFLRECRRVMKRGAVLRISVPHAGVLIKRYSDHELGDFDELSEGCEKAGSEAGKLWELLLAGHSAIYDFHALSSAAEAAGLRVDMMTGFRKSSNPQLVHETLDLYPGLSLFIDAIKP